MTNLTTATTEREMDLLDLKCEEARDASRRTPDRLIFITQTGPEEFAQHPDYPKTGMVIACYQNGRNVSGQYISCEP